MCVRALQRARSMPCMRYGRITPANTVRQLTLVPLHACCDTTRIGNTCKQPRRYKPKFQSHLCALCGKVE